MSDQMKDGLYAFVMEIVKQAPSVAVLIVVLMHQQQQIHLLLEKCLIVAQVCELAP